MVPRGNASGLPIPWRRFVEGTTVVRRLEFAPLDARLTLRAG
jgi:hypothetical protein